MIILLSYEQQYPNEVAILEQMFERGLTTFHLRKPNWSKEEMRSLLNQIDQKYHHRIVLHDHYELIYEFDLKGLHFNTRNERDDYTFCSASIHSFEEVEKYGKDNEYIFLSPIFDSISKEGYNSRFKSEDLLSFLTKEHETKIIALGGVELSNMDHCFNLGFDGVALLGSVWNTEEPVKAIDEILNTVSSPFIPCANAEASAQAFRKGKLTEEENA